MRVLAVTLDGFSKKQWGALWVCRLLLVATNLVALAGVFAIGQLMALTASAAVCKAGMRAFLIAGAWLCVGSTVLLNAVA